MVPGNNNFIQVLWIIGASHTHPHAEVKKCNKYLCYNYNPIPIIKYNVNTNYDKYNITQHIHYQS